MNKTEHNSVKKLCGCVFSVVNLSMYSLQNYFLAKFCTRRADVALVHFCYNIFRFISAFLCCCISFSCCQCYFLGIIIGTMLGDWLGRMLTKFCIFVFTGSCFLNWEHIRIATVLWPSVRDIYVSSYQKKKHFPATNFFFYSF